MTRHSDEEWLVRVQLPEGLDNPARYFAGVLKELGRRWGVKCVAILDPDATHQPAQDERSAPETTDRPAVKS